MIKKITKLAVEQLDETTWLTGVFRCPNALTF